MINLQVPFSTPNLDQWDQHILACQGHLLQSWAWGELKSRFGWSVYRLQAGPAAAQVLFRRLPLGFTIAYIPKGPLLDWAQPDQCRPLLAAIHAEARRRRAILLKIEPNLWSAEGNPHPLENPPPSPRESGGSRQQRDERFSSLGDAPPAHNGSSNSNEAALNFLTASGFIPADTIQPRTSLLIDISSSEADILAAMKQKTRYNIRLAEKKGVKVYQGSAADVSTFYQLAQVTAARDGFGVHSLEYYRAAFQLFSPERCALWLAEFEGQPLAALMAFCQGEEAYYFYGASSNQQRHLMAPYLIQWAAIRWAKRQGCTRYDLWGIPDANLASLEAEFERRHTGLWGVYRFKRGFGGQWVQSVGAFDYVYQPLLYRLYKFRRHI